MSRKRLFGGPNYYNEHENKKIYSRSWLTLNEKAQNLNLPAYDYLGGADALPYRAVHSWWQALLALCVGRWRITERKSASWLVKPTTRLLSFALINLRKSNKAKQVQGRAVLSDNAMYAEAVSQLVRSCVATDILWGFRVTRWLLHFVWCISRGSVPAPSLWNANCLCRVASENCHMAFRVCMAKPFYSNAPPPLSWLVTAITTGRYYCGPLVGHRTLAEATGLQPLIKKCLAPFITAQQLKAYKASLLYLDTAMLKLASLIYVT